VDCALYQDDGHYNNIISCNLSRKNRTGKKGR
jgi:hypothetical protein